jgi:predicted O-methyltransferase YrrM
MKGEKQTNCRVEKVLLEIEEAAQRDFLPIVGPNRGKILADEVRKAKPRHVLEVGTLIGYSGILMGKELGEDAEIVTVEIHRDEAETAGVNIVKSKITPKVTIITGNALEVIPTLKPPFDFVFIDAEKTE